MEAIQIGIVLRILDHFKIPSCLTGELALLYYNVPRVLHVGYLSSVFLNFSETDLVNMKDIEICIPADSLSKAESSLCSVGLFVRRDLENFDLYSEYKRGFPRLQSTSWSSPTLTVVLLSDVHCGLRPLQKVITPQSDDKGIKYSSQLTDLLPETQLRRLPFPRLPSFFSSLCQRFIETNDAVARIAAEQLVDGMNIGHAWCDGHLAGVSKEVRQLAKRLVDDKDSRLDDFSENLVTCFIANEEEASELSRIPGYN